MTQLFLARDPHIPRARACPTYFYGAEPRGSAHQNQVAVGHFVLHCTVLETLTTTFSKTLPNIIMGGFYSTKSQKEIPIEIILANVLIFVKRKARRYYRKLKYFVKETFISAFGYFRSALRQTVTFSDVDQYAIIAVIAFLLQ